MQRRPGSGPEGAAPPLPTVPRKRVGQSIEGSEVCTIIFTMNLAILTYLEEIWPAPLRSPPPCNKASLILTVLDERMTLISRAEESSICLNCRWGKKVNLFPSLHA